MERVHRKILRTVQGLPVRCKSSLLTSLLGSLPIEDLVIQRKLSFVISLVNLDDSCLPKQVLYARCSSSDKLLLSYNNMLGKLNLPNLKSLLTSAYSSRAWKCSVKKQLLINSLLQLPDNCQAYPIADCDFKLERPLHQWQVGLGDSRLTRMKLFRINLLVGCAGLEDDAPRFRVRDRGGFNVGDRSCKLCGHEVEDAHHFIAVCPGLASIRSELLNAASDTIKTNLPNPSAFPKEFSNTTLGIVWIKHPPTQNFCIQFLNQLRNSRTAILFPALTSKLFSRVPIV